MNPWALRALDLAVALIAGAGLVLILVTVLARRPSFADRVAQGRVQERAPSAIAAWARRVSASALDSLGSTSESVARRLALAGMNTDVSVFRLRQAVAGVAGLVAACALVSARHASSLRASLIPLCACALVGILLNLFWPTAPRWLTTLVYVALGWVAVWYLPQLWAGGGPIVVWLIVAGGVLYTLGAVVYGTKKPDPSPTWFGFHEIFHAFTVAAWACHCVAVYLAVLNS